MPCRSPFPPHTLLHGLLSAALALAPNPAEALLLFKMRQVTEGIAVTGEGTYTTNGLTLVDQGELPPPYGGNPQSYVQSELDSFFAYLLVGPDGNIANKAFIWKSSQISTGPQSFGSVQRQQIGTGFSIATAGQASVTGIDPTFGYVLLPYGDGQEACPTNPNCTVVSSTTIFGGLSFADLGVTPGSYSWSWGNSPDQKFQLDIEVPGPLPALGGAAAFAWSRRLRRRVNLGRWMSGVQR
jgi:hypothetical protein